jgi:hypothetical protein
MGNIVLTPYTCIWEVYRSSSGSRSRGVGGGGGGGAPAAEPDA